MNEITINGTADLHRAASEFLEATKGCSLIAFYGQMGAGKTTFITAICDTLGVQDNVGSPTFTIVNEYRSAAGKPVYHFDFYRINKIAEVLDIGVFEYFDSGALCLMEWPEIVEEILPEETLKVKIIPVDEHTRKLQWE